MRDIIKWVSESRAEKDIGPAMTYYSVRSGEIRATNGRITAGYPWPDDSAAFLVSGAEFEKVLARMGDAEVAVEQSLDGAHLTVSSDKFTATIDTLPPDAWAYPGVEDATWMHVPLNFVDVLRALRAFISDNPAQAWAGCVALESGNCYATNNIAVAGCACDVGNVQALLPSYAVDFLLRRTEGLEQWACTDNYAAFRWTTGAWLRSQLVIGKFPERAAALVREAYAIEPDQEITDDFREAFGHVASLAEDTIRIYADRMESKFKKSVIVASCVCEVPTPPAQGKLVTTDPDANKSSNYRGVKKGKEVLKAEPFEPADPNACSVWGAQFLAPVISQATHWQPRMWPKPAPFRGDSVAGFVVGRKGE